jgi:hypothetical protein
MCVYIYMYEEGKKHFGRKKRIVTLGETKKQQRKK